MVDDPDMSLKCQTLQTKGNAL